MEKNIKQPMICNHFLFTRFISFPLNQGRQKYFFLHSSPGSEKNRFIVRRILVAKNRAQPGKF